MTAIFMIIILTAAGITAILAGIFKDHDRSIW